MKRVLTIALIAMSHVVFGQSSTQQSSQPSNDPDWIQVNCEEIPDELMDYLRKNGHVRTTHPFLDVEPERASNFLDNVVYFAKVTNEVLLSLNKGINKFAETPLGVISCLMIAYQVVGAELLDYLMHALFMLVFFTIFYLWWKRQVLPRTRLDNISENGERHYTFLAPWFVSQIVWAAVFIVVMFFFFITLGV